MYLLVLLFIMQSYGNNSIHIIDKEASYTIFHPFKKVTSKSTEYTSKVFYKNNKLDSIYLVAEVTSFKCGISWIDEWALRIVEWNKYNDIKIRSKKITHNHKNYTANIILDFHGVSKELNIPITITKAGNKLNSEFFINISDFNLKRPSPFGIPVKEYIKITINLYLGK